MFSAFSIPEINSSSSSLICEKTLAVIELLVCLVWRSLAFFRTDLLLRINFKYCLYLITIFLCLWIEACEREL